MSRDEFDEVSSKAFALFSYGQRVAFEHGLLLVDTKYEFGKADDGSILLIDEEFLRLWFKENCDPYGDEVLPDAPPELVSELSWRYIFLYETITGSKFDLPNSKEPIHDRITRNVSQAMLHL